MPSSPSIRIGTRGSALALAQATTVRAALEAAGVEATLAIITTEGDRRAPDTAWGEGAFVSAIEAALLGGEIDVAVHSAKDVPTDEDPRLEIAAYLERAPAGDVVVLPSDDAGRSLADLPRGIRVGTDSPRRTAFLRAVRPDLVVHPLHGNVDTRLRRLDEGQSDALVLAEAGLTRLGRANRISFRLDPATLPPAPGQGAIAVQARTGDAATIEQLRRLDHRPTRLAVEAERAILAASGGGCRAPLGALGRLRGDSLELLVGFARPDGSVAVVRKRDGPAGDPQLVDRLLAELAAEVGAAAMAANFPRVVMTRAMAQSAALGLALVDRGLAPLAVPAIEIAPAEDGLGPALARLADFNWVVVTSANAARAIGATADRLDVPLAGGPTRWAAVGTATARALRSIGVRVDLRPERSSGAGMADALPLSGGERVLVPRSEIADERLPAALAARGATVEAVAAYRTLEAPEASVPLLRRALGERPIGTILTSGSTARGLLALGRRAGAVDRVLEIPAICIGPSTAAEAHRAGFRVVAESAGQDAAGIAEAAARALLPRPISHPEVP